MKKTHYLIISLLLCAACHSKDQSLEKELAASLENNNQFAENQINLLLREIVNKDVDPKTHWNAEIWKSRVAAIQKLSRGLYAYIDSIKTRPDIQTRETLNMLLDKVERYRQSIPDIFLNDSFPSANIQQDFEKDVKRLNIELPFATTAQMSFVSATASPAVWNKIKNDILLSEYQLIRYLNIHIPEYDDSYTVFSPLIHLNYSQLKKGQQLVLTAGIGAYSTTTTKVTIDGQQFKLNAEGYAQYRTIVNSSPGKHNIPVRVEYTRPDGATAFYTKNVQYEIAP